MQKRKYHKPHTYMVWYDKAVILYTASGSTDISVDTGGSGNAKASKIWDNSEDNFY